MPKDTTYRPPKSSGKNRRISPALRRISESALQVTDEMLRSFHPQEVHLDIIQCMLAGAITYAEISELCGRSSATISKSLCDPLAYAYIARTVSSLLHTRVGVVDCALYRRACTGDPRAVEAFYKRVGAMAPRKTINLNGNLGDVTRFTDEDLANQIAAEVRSRPDLVVEVSSSECSEPPSPPPEDPPFEEAAE